MSAMRPAARPSLLRGRWRRGVAALMLLVFMLASQGVLLSPAALAVRAARAVGAAHAPAERYPCESCACACASARECWTSCCCFSPARRLAWARRNGISPPAYAVLAPAEPEQGDCPLCRDDPHGDEPAPAGPALSALACKGVSVLMMTPAVPAALAAGTPQRRGLAVGLLVAAGDLRVSSRTLDVPTPPPRV